MKIAYISPVFPPLSSGMGTACFYTANEIGKSHNVTVFLADRKIDYKQGNFKIKLFKPLFSFGYADFAPQIMKLVKNFDVVHLYYPYFGVAEFLWFLKKIKRKKCPKIIFHYQMDMVGKGITKFVNNLHQKIIAPFLFKTVDQVFVLSDDYARHSKIKKYYFKYSEKFKVVPNGVDIEKFKPNLNTENIKNKLNLKDTDKIIFTAQALDKAHFFKGIDVLIKAIKIINHQDVKLLIAGEGNLLNYYKKLVNKFSVHFGVIFLGNIDHNELPLYYNLATVVPVPSTQPTESFSITAVEAMACGAPVVVSDWPGLRVTSDKNKSGLIVKPNDARDLAKKLLFFINDTEKTKQFGQEGRKKVEKEYNWKKICEKIINYYKFKLPTQKNKGLARHSPVELLKAKAGKHICLITSVFAPYTKGGAETVVNNIVKGFKKTNHKIFIITICEFKNLRSLLPKKTIENNLIIYRFYPLNLFSYLNINKYAHRPFLRLFWHAFDMFNLHSYWVIKYILKKEKPEVSMTHMLKGVGYLTCRAIKKCKVKNIHTLHEVQLATPSGLILKNEENSWQHNFFLTKLYQIYNRWAFNNPEIIISSSKFLLEFYNQRRFFPKSKKIILTNPINIKTLKSSFAKPACRQGRATADRHQNIKTFANIANDNKFTFLFLGQVEKYKGVLFLINVFKKLLSEQNNNKNINLLIAGTGTALDEAKKLASDCSQIIFKGYIPNSELNTIFVQTNATIVSSLCYENSPTVIFESLSNGVPVLAARIGGIEFIKDDFNGFTFEAGDTEDLLKILKFSLQNKKQLANMSTNCVESVKEIGVEKYIKKLEKLI